MYDNLGRYNRTITPATSQVYWDEVKPVGKILDVNGKTLVTVMPKRNPIGYRHPNCPEE